jgi:hypothetical protein
MRGGAPAAGPGAGFGWPQCLPGLAFEAQVRPGRRRQPRSLTQVTSRRVAIAASSRSAARCAGTCGVQLVRYLQRPCGATSPSWWRWHDGFGDATALPLVTPGTPAAAVATDRLVGASRDATHLGHHLHKVRPTGVGELRRRIPIRRLSRRLGYRCSARSSDGLSLGVVFLGRNSRLVVTNGVFGQPSFCPGGRCR